MEIVVLAGKKPGYYLEGQKVAVFHDAVGTKWAQPDAEITVNASVRCGVARRKTTARLFFLMRPARAVPVFSAHGKSRLAFQPVVSMNTAYQVVRTVEGKLEVRKYSPQPIYIHAATPLEACIRFRESLREEKKMVERMAARVFSEEKQIKELLREHD